MQNPMEPAPKSALQLLEESVHLLRRAGIETLGAYCIGVLPFVLAMLYFWADMSQSPFAQQHMVEASAGLAVLLVWMKCWQAVFMRRMLAKACGDAPPRWTVRQIASMVVTQTIIQPWGLLVLPLAAIFVLPLPGILAVLNTATLLGDGQEDMTTGGVLRQSWRLGMLWPGQSMCAILAILPVIWLVAMLNVIQAIIIPPDLMKLLLGVDTFFSRGGFSYLNSTFMATVVCITYVCIDPLVKAFFTLRCFHGRSIQTGQDLRAELKSLSMQNSPAAGAGLSRTIGAAVVLAVLALAPSPLSAQEQAPPVPTNPAATPPGAVGPEQLDNSIRQVVSRRQYTWRMPREKSQLRGLLDAMLQKVKDWQAGRKQAEKPSLPPPGPPTGGYHGSSGMGLAWAGALQLLVYILIVVAAGALIWLLVNAWLNRRRKQDSPADDEPIAASPDLEDEDVTADHLPEEGWLDLARQMLAQGDRRLAMRALYLASLALLSERQMLTIAKFKSNREYQAEVSRRGHSVPEVTTAFGQNVTFFEDAWYGMHDVTESIINNFALNQDRIRSTATGGSDVTLGAEGATSR